MRVMRRLGLMVLVLAGLWGCAKELPPEAYPAAKTPRQLLLNQYNARLAGDREAYLACFKTHDMGRSILAAEFDNSQAKVAYITTYAATFPNPRAVPLTPHPFAVTDADILAKDDVAYYSRSEAENAVVMIREEGIWRIDATGKPRVLSDRDIMGKRMTEMETEMLRDVTEKMSEPGATAESINDELARRRSALFDQVARELLPVPVFNGNTTTTGP